MNKFEKVSFEQYLKDYRSTFSDSTLPDTGIKEYYDDIKLPKRATTGSAGYDIFLPFPVSLYSMGIITIPTGLKVHTNCDTFLMILPRSGLGFKNFTRLANTAGVVDSDYIQSDNEGHIFIKMRLESLSANSNLRLDVGQAFAQGIFLPYEITVDDEVDTKRNGGIGSTS